MAAVASPSQHVTRKSFKSQQRDKPIHSAKLLSGGAPRKGGGGGGKGTWGRPGDEAKDDVRADRADPVYTDDEDSAGDVWEPAPAEAKKFNQGALDLSAYKRVMRDAVEEWVNSDDLVAFLAIVKKETRAVFQQELPVILVRMGLEKSGAVRARLQALLRSLAEQGILNKHHIAQAYRKLFNSLDELRLDAPNAQQLITESLQACAKESLVESKVADGLLSSVRLLSDTAAVTAAKKKIRVIVEDFLSSGESKDARQSLVELGAPHLHFEVVKQLVQSALDRSDNQRELVSTLLAELTGDVIAQDEVTKAFSILLSRVEDLYLDVRAILRLLSSFLARAVRDEALPPAFLLSVDLPAGDMAAQVVRQAQVLLAQPRASVRLGRVWGARPSAEEDDEDAGDGGAGGITPTVKSGASHVSRAKKRQMRAKARAAGQARLEGNNGVGAAGGKPSAAPVASPVAAPPKEEKKKVVQKAAAPPAEAAPVVAPAAATAAPKEEAKKGGSKAQQQAAAAPAKQEVKKPAQAPSPAAPGPKDAAPKQGGGGGKKEAGKKGKK